MGVHYIGEVHKPHAVLRRVFDVISDGKIEWAPMDPVYDRIIIGDTSYDFTAGRNEFKAALIARFPDEAEAIEKYVELLGQVSARVPKFFAGQALPAGIGSLYAPSRPYWMPDYMQQSTRTVLESLTKNQELIGVLTGQWGDYGLPPGKSSFMMHAMLAKHYLAGGNYPVGGSSSIARHIIPVIEAAGGHVFTYAGVEQTLVGEHGAYGVKLKKGGHCLYADQVVSCAGLIPTVERLLPPDLPARTKWQAKLKKVKLSASHVCLYLGLKGEAADLGLPRTNYWVYPGYDHDATFARFLAADASGVSRSASRREGCPNPR